MNFIFFEQRSSKEDILQKLYIKEDIRVKSLIKIFLWRDAPKKNRWMDIVRSTAAKVDKVKGTDGFLPFHDLSKELWYCWGYSRNARYLQILCEDARDEERNLTIPEYSSENLFNYLKEYLLWLARALSEKGAVSRTENRDRLNELLEKYPVK